MPASIMPVGLCQVIMLTLVGHCG